MSQAPFSVVMADPPWRFEYYSGKPSKRAPENHYATMPLSEIQALPVVDVCAKNAALLLWVTAPLLKQGIATGEAWGLEYKTFFVVWVKRTTQDNFFHKGLGYYTRSNAELCLLFTRGNPKRIGKDVGQIIYDPDLLPLFEPIIAPRTRHSEKPKEAYTRAERLFGDVPRLAIFERKPRPGWVCLGNEIDGLDIREALANLKGELCPR